MSGTVTPHPDSLESVLNSNLTLCTKCKQPLTGAHTLPCLHSYCRACLVTSSRKQTENDSISKGSQADVELECVACSNEESYQQTEFCSNVYFDNLVKINKLQSLSRRNLCDYCFYEKDGDKSKVEAELPTPMVEQVCLVCCDALCRGCSIAHKKTKLTRDHPLVSIDDVRTHANMADIRSRQEAICSEHAPAPLTLCCTGCEQPACAYCMSSSAHKLCGGKAVEARERAFPVRSQLQRLEAEMEESVTAYTAYLKSCDRRDRQAKSRTAQVREEIKKRISTLHQVIEEYAKFLNLQLGKSSRDRDQEYHTHRPLVTDYVSRTEYTRTVMKSLTTHAKDSELNVLRPSLEQACARIGEMEPPSVKETDGQTLLELSLSMSPIESKAMIEKVFGQLVPVGLPLSDEDKEAVESLPQTAVKAGNLTLLMETPVLMAEFECAAPGDDKTLWPSGLAVNNKGQILVCDRENQKIKIFSAEGEFLLQVTGEGTEYELINPFDAATTQDNRIVVTDYGRDSVLVFTPEGHGLATLKGPFKYPRGVAVWSSGSPPNEEIFVLDSELGHVTIHDGKTYQLKQIIKGQETNAKRELVDPYYITLAPSRRSRSGDNMLITDLASPHVHILDRKGHHKNFHSDYGLRPGEMLHPYGICVDRHGYTFIADNENNRVLAFTTSGHFERILIGKKNSICEDKGRDKISSDEEKNPGSSQSENRAKGSLWHPMTLALTKEGYLIVAEGLGKVKIFKYYE